MKRKGLISILAVSALSFATVGMTTLQTAKAENQAESAIAWLEDGASVRFGSAGNGLRFTMQIKASEFDETATYGILIAPEEGYTLNEANVFGANAVYNWAVKGEDGKWSYTAEAGKTQIVNLVTEGFNDDTVVINGETVEVKEFYGSLVNLNELNIAKEFRAVGYIRTGTEGNYDYTLVGDSDNVRSMAYVAQLAIEDTTDTAPTAAQKTQLQTMYVDKVTNNPASYTQEYYLQQANGEYVKIDELTETLNEYNGVATTIADPVAFVGKDISGYEQVSGKGTLSGNVYANDKLVLTAYYNRIAIETIQGEARMQEVDGEFDLMNLLTSEQADTFAAYAALGEVTWKLNGVAVDGSTVDFATTTKRLYTVTASVGEELAYTAEIDFYNADERAVWSTGVSVDDLVIKLDVAGVTKGIATNPAGKTGSYYQVTTENAQYLAFVKPAHSLAYYEVLKENGVALSFNVYVNSSTSTDTLMAFGTNTIQHIYGSKWYTITIPLDTLLANWSTVFDARITADWKDAIFMTRDATTTTFYISEMTFTLETSVDTFVDTTDRMIDLNGATTYAMNNILTTAGVTESLYADKDLVWTLTPLYGGDEITITDGTADFGKIAKRAYKAAASVSKFGMQSPIYTGVVDFYDQNDGFVWNDISTEKDVWGRTGSSWTDRNSESSVEGEQFATVVSLTEEGHTGSYYKLSNLNAEDDSTSLTVWAYVLPYHTKAYYEKYRDNYTFTYEVYASNGRWTFDWNITDGNCDVLNGWDTVTMSMANVLDTYWNKILGTEASAGSSGEHCPMLGPDMTKETFFFYIGNFHVVETTTAE